MPIEGQDTGRCKGYRESRALLGNACRLVILAGTQVWHCRARDQLRAFVGKTDIPTYLNRAARGCLPPESKHHFTRSRRHAFFKADLVMVVGTPFDFRLGYGGRIASEAKIIWR